jgi:hypothetical protein
MSTRKKLRLVNLGDGITGAKEEWLLDKDDWLDELTKPEKEEEKKEQEVHEYARKLAEKAVALEAAISQASKIAEHALRLQKAQEQAERKVKEANHELEEQFYALAQQWRNETAHLSLASEQANNFAYHQIIGMGEKVLPLIFRELRETTSDWFWALRAIARDKAPVIPPEDKGKVRRIAEIWMEWGKQHGHVSG